MPGATEIPAERAGIDPVIAALEKNVQAMIKADRKVTALKELQVWGRTYYRNCLRFVSSVMNGHNP